MGSISTLPSPKGGEDVGALTEMVALLSKQVQFVINNLSSKNINEIGGFLVDLDRFTSYDGDVGMSTADTFLDDVRFWSGSTDMENAPFRVHKSGKVYTHDLEAVDSTITGASIIGASITGGDINVTTDLYVGSNIYLQGSGFFDGRVQFGNEFCYIRGANNEIDLTAFFGVYANGSEIATKDWVDGRLAGGTVTISGHNHGIGSGTSLEVTGGGATTFVSSGGGTYYLSF